MKLSRGLSIGRVGLLLIIMIRCPLYTTVILTSRQSYSVLTGRVFLPICPES